VCVRERETLNPVFYKAILTNLIRLSSDVLEDKYATVFHNTALEELPSGYCGMLGS